MLKGNRQGRDKMIKIIDWISRIMAVLLAIGTSFFMILYAALVDPDEFGWNMVILPIIFCSIPPLGLFLAPAVREKGRKCRFIIAILILPITLILFAFFIDCIIVGGIKIFGSNGSMRGIGGFTLGFVLISIGIIVCLTQYNLLFRGILFKPIYLRRLLVGKRENICTGTEDKSVGVPMAIVENGMKNRVPIIKTIGLYLGVVFIGIGILSFLWVVNYNIKVYGSLENKILANRIEKRIEKFGMQVGNEKKEISVELNKIIGDIKWDRIYVVSPLRPTEGIFSPWRETIGIQWKGASEWFSWVYLRDVCSWNFLIIKGKNVIPIKINRYIVEVEKKNKTVYSVYYRKENIKMRFYYTHHPIPRKYLAIVTS